MQILLPTTTTHQQGTDQSLSSQQQGKQGRGGGWGWWVSGTREDEHGSKSPAKQPKQTAPGKQTSQLDKCAKTDFFYCILFTAETSTQNINQAQQTTQPFFFLF